jgi:hypothetical protein
MIKNLNRQSSSNASFAAIAVVVVGALLCMQGCRDLQKRRVEVKQSSGADADLQDRFGLTADAQDPSERDKELGYGRWQTKPETEGTASPTSPSRRKSIGGNP